MSSEKDAKTTTAITNINSALEDCSIDKVRELPAMEQAIVLANGMRALRTALTDEIVEKLLMPLQGSSLGFRTDKDAGQGYPVAVVKDCVIEAMIRGFQPVGNEFNIIAGRAYFTKEGFTRKVAEFKGLTDLEFEIGVPHNAGEKGALVPYVARWKLNGKPDQIVRDVMKREDGSVSDQRIPIRVNSGMGADAILGKARRKILAQVYEKISGVKFAPTDGEAIDTDGVEVTGTGEPQKSANEKAADDLAAKHRAKVAEAKKNGKQAAEDAPKGDPAADSSGHAEPGANG